MCKIGWNCSVLYKIISNVLQYIVQQRVYKSRWYYGLRPAMFLIFEMHVDLIWFLFYEFPVLSSAGTWGASMGRIFWYHHIYHRYSLLYHQQTACRTWWYCVGYHYWRRFKVKLHCLENKVKTFLTFIGLCTYTFLEKTCSIHCVFNVTCMCNVCAWGCLIWSKFVKQELCLHEIAQMLWFWNPNGIISLQCIVEMYFFLKRSIKFNHFSTPSTVPAHLMHY